MMKKITISVFSILISLMLSFGSCNFLDVEDYFDDTMQYDSIFSNYEYLQKYMWATASQFPDEGFILRQGWPAAMACDEGFTSFDKNNFLGIKYALGEIDESNIAGYAMSTWDDMYKIIRKTNIILSRKHEASLTGPEDDEITGYTLFMRAYAYYRLLKDYGPVILIGDEVFPNNEQPEAYNRSRATYDECVEYICDQFEEAASYLPIEVSSNFFGRPTRGAALALIARIRLFHASPLFNGGQAARTSFGNWTNKEGVHYVSQTYDEKRWAIAAAAAKRVINLAETGVYSLHTVTVDIARPPMDLPANVPTADFPDGAGGIDHFRSYSEMFTSESTPSKNKEFIFAKFSDNVRATTQHSFPEDILGGYNASCITQKVIDSFYMMDGRDKNDASEEYPYWFADNYDDSYFTESAVTFSGYTLPSGVHKMYTNREMRFYAMVGFSGRHWPINGSTTTERKNKVVVYHSGGVNLANNEYFSGKGASLINPLNYPATGYVITKWIHPDDSWSTPSIQTAKPFAIIRYAEILLSYAEALNNLETSYTVELPSIYGKNQGNDTYTVSRNESEIAKYFNQIRFRAGLPGLTSAELSNATQMQSVLEREYMLEFLFENKRFYDVRRWGIYEETERTGIYGARLGEDKYNYYRSPILVDQVNNRNRVIDKKMVLFPLPKAEVRRVEDLDQNPGWGD